MPANRYKGSEREEKMKKFKSDPRSKRLTTENQILALIVEDNKTKPGFITYTVPEFPFWAVIRVKKGFKPVVKFSDGTIQTDLPNMWQCKKACIDYLVKRYTIAEWEVKTLPRLRGEVPDPETEQAEEETADA